MFLCIVV